MDIIQGWAANIGILLVDGKIVEVPLEYENSLVHYLSCPVLLHDLAQCVAIPTSSTLPQPHKTPKPVQQPKTHRTMYNNQERRNHRPRRKQTRKYQTNWHSKYSDPNAEGWIQVHNCHRCSIQTPPSNSRHQASSSGFEPNGSRNLRRHQNRLRQGPRVGCLEYRQKLVPMDIDPKPLIRETPIQSSTPPR